MSNRSMDTFWTEAKMDGLRDLWPTNLSVDEIGGRLGCSKSAAASKARRMSLGDKPHPRRRLPPRRHSVVNDPAKREQVRQMTQDGSTYRDIAAATGISESSVSEIRRVMSIKTGHVRKAPWPVKAAPKPRPSPIPRPPPPRPPPLLPAANVSMPAKRCLWFHGEGKQMIQCDGEQAERKPFCAEHAARAYRPNEERRPSMDRRA
jgi:hypothetical protein